MIAIIAILAAILFPVFAQAREKARQASCSSNLKQIGVAVMMYAQDYDEMLPPQQITPWGSNARLFGHYDLLAPYTKNEQVFICPSGHYSDKTHRTDLPAGAGFYRQVLTSSYASLRSSSVGHKTEVPMAPKALSDIPKPAETILIFETNYRQPHWPYDCGFDDDTLEPLPMASNGTVGYVCYRHSGQMNVLYCDGHVKSTPQIMDFAKFGIIR